MVIKLKEDLDRMRAMPVFLAVNYIRKGMGYDAWLLERFGEKGTHSDDESGNIMEFADMIQKYVGIEE